MDFPVFRSFPETILSWAADIQIFVTDIQPCSSLGGMLTFTCCPITQRQLTPTYHNFAWPVLLILVWRVAKITIFISMFLRTVAILL